MIKLFDESYLAVSNLIVKTYDGESYVFLSPLSIHATIENEARNTKNEITFKFLNYHESPLILEYTFSCFFFLLTPYYKINTMYFGVLQRQNIQAESSGYKATYIFNNENLISNIGLTEIYDDFKKVSKTSI